MECNCNGEIENSYSTTDEHGAKGNKFFAQPMCDSKEQATTQYTNENSPDFINPILINGILNKKSNAQHEDCYADLVS